MVRPRTDHDRPPTPVAASWRRIEAWLGDHVPAIGVSLRPGVPPEDLARFEAETGLRLPDDVRASWLIRDGQKPIPWSPAIPEDGPDEEDSDDEDEEEAGTPIYNGLIFGMELLPLIDAGASLTTKSVLSEYRRWEKVVADGGNEALDHDCTSYPVGAIRCRYASRGWVPLHAEEGSSDCLGIDLEPGPNGVVGQVINFGRDQRAKYVLACSWAQFLEDVAEELEAGNFVVNDDSEVKLGGLMLQLQMRWPRKGRLAGNYRAWSEAKVARPTEEP